MGIATSRNRVMVLCLTSTIPTEATLVLAESGSIHEDWIQLCVTSYSEADRVVELPRDDGNITLEEADGFTLWAHEHSLGRIKSLPDLPGELILRLERALAELDDRVHALQAKRARKAYEWERSFCGPTRDLAPETNQACHQYPPSQQRAKHNCPRARQRTQQQSRQLYGRPMRSMNK